MKIKAVAFVGYPVTKIERSRKFYEEILGLTTEREYLDDEGCWIEYDIGDVTLAISNMSSEWKSSSDGPSIALELEDFEDAIKELKGKNVKFAIEPFDTPVCHIAVILDPDCNSITLHMKKASHPENQPPEKKE